LEGLEYIGNRLAPKNADIQYFVVGSVKDFFYNKYHVSREFPDNVHLFGVLEEDEKFELYKLADYAINPIFSGAGINVKMLEYMAAGLPIISTAFGARGIDLAKFFNFENEEEFFTTIALLANNDQLQNDLILNNLWGVKTYYDFQTLADKIRDFIYKELLEDYSSFLVDRLSAELLPFSQIDYDLIYSNLALELSKII
jgi:glycosyltransferase involved in cell wall biosynthesis